MFRSALSWKNAWRIRMVALGIIVLMVGTGSQVLVNAVAALADTTGTNTDLVTVKVTAYTASGRMADGNWTFAGACTVSPSQFPLGTIIALYDANGSLVRQCTAEDTNKTIPYGDIELAMPGNALSATQWGMRNLSAQVIRLGWGPGGPPNLAATSARPLSPIHLVKSPFPRFK